MPSLAHSGSPAVVIGGGFYGARLALLLRELGYAVRLVEREPHLLGRASLRNQARVHNGYHYPRSILTSLRSRLNYARFLADYPECVDEGFAHYYAIARGTSKVTAAQFTEFCRRIEAPIAPAPRRVQELFDRNRIEAVFEVRECGFDAARLRERIAGDLAEAGVEVSLSTEAVRLARPAWTPHAADDDLVVTVSHDGATSDVTATLVINATYSRLNGVLHASGASIIPMKQELAELALVVPPPELEGAAVTVMDGPFFSLMPYPSRGLFTLSHVRYTPHGAWHDSARAPLTDGDVELRAHPASRHVHMLRDAERYLPVLRGARYVDSMWEIKALMPRSEHDDSRPILLRRSAEFPNCITVLGGKIDSVYDVEDSVRAELASKVPTANGH